MARIILLFGVLLAISTFQFTHVIADTGANCTNFIGKWTYSRGPTSSLGAAINCSLFTIADAVTSLSLDLSAPNLVTTSSGSQGNWTRVYNQGVEVWIEDTIWFAFSSGNYSFHPSSLCSSTRPGWTHRNDRTEWACYIAIKDDEEREEEKKENQEDQEHQKQEEERWENEQGDKEITLQQFNDDNVIDDDEDTAAAGFFHTDHALIARINSVQSSWVAGAYPHMDGRSIREVQARRGGNYANFIPTSTSSTKRKNASTVTRLKSIPDSWDWRNVNGVNYVSPVRDQSGCGSCYAFSTAGMLESRLLILSNLTVGPILSPQSIISCSSYSQGCSGGFPYLVTKDAFDHSWIEEDCMPYIGDDTPCTLDPLPGCQPEKTWTVSEYYYVGGYFGAATEQAMQEEILSNGPVVVCFEVDDDFDYYKSGVYIHNATTASGGDSLVESWGRSSVNPQLIPVNHAVLAVGWGVTDDGNHTPYWIIKNSWGHMWGQAGYFWILRGAANGGECGIESMPVAATPVLQPTKR